MSLYLYNNDFTGSIPAALCNLANLKTLYLNDNQLSGEIPSEIGNLANLEELLLDNNSFSGQIPLAIGKLTKLTFLSLNNNQLTGSIPSVITNLTKLISLMISGNKLSGMIPNGLKNMAKLSNSVSFFKYNALYSDDPTLITFLNNIDNGWQSTQTISPKNITTGVVTESTVNQQGDRRHAPTTAANSSRVMHSGFSTKTVLPASRAAMN